MKSTVFALGLVATLALVSAEYEDPLDEFGPRALPSDNTTVAPGKTTVAPNTTVAPGKTTVAPNTTAPTTAHTLAPTTKPTTTAQSTIAPHNMNTTMPNNINTTMPHNMNTTMPHNMNTTMAPTTAPYNPQNANFMYFSYFMGALGLGDNLGCNLGGQNDHAMFVRLPETRDYHCIEMPSLYDANNPAESHFYYRLKFKADNTTIEKFEAVCSDPDCMVCTIKVDGNDNTDTFAYDECQRTSSDFHDRNHSWFAKAGNAASKDHVCVPEQTEANNDGSVSIMFFDDTGSAASIGDNGDECEMKDAAKPVYVWTTPTIVNGECQRIQEGNTFGDFFRLTLNYKEGLGQVEGSIFCKDMNCTDCVTIIQELGTCVDGIVVSDTKHIGLMNGDANGINTIPLCSEIRTSVPPVTGTTTYPVPSEPKKSNSLPIIIGASSVVGALVIGYIVFVVLRRRKMRRMNAYAALQDDPTF